MEREGRIRDAVRELRLYAFGTREETQGDGLRPRLRN